LPEGKLPGKQKIINQTTSQRGRKRTKNPPRRRTKEWSAVTRKEQKRGRGGEKGNANSKWGKGGGGKGGRHAPEGGEKVLGGTESGANERWRGSDDGVNGRTGKRVLNEGEGEGGVTNFSS